MDNTNNILELPIERLNLSLRTYSCLKNFNINKVQDLTSYNTSDLFRVRNLGERCCYEIINKIHELGLCFEDEKEEIKGKRI